ncbi:MAG: OmpA family protein [Flavobacteriaceae bacterium]|nr:OmpA family protein [Flavobacteriaceae bacterium]
MKNFGWAFLVFLIWAFFGAWIHAELHPQKEKLIKTPLPKEKAAPIPIVVKDTVIVKPVLKDSILKVVPVKPFPKKIIYLGFNQKDFTDTDSIYVYTKALINYINKNDSTQIYIVGHTDSVGDERDNYWIGLERAKNFKTFLIVQGIDKQRIHTDSKGEEEPFSENQTATDRKKNRRIEITVKPNTNE